MQKEFTKADLKDWMVIDKRNKKRYVILGEKLLNDIGFNCMDGIEDDLTDKFKTKDFDIIKVYKLNTKKIYKLGDIFKDENLELIWERTKTKHMTTEEMRAKLEELTGEKIEVELSREEMVGACYGFCRNQKCLDGCPLFKIGSCRFKNYSDRQLKQCYEKVIADGKK